jgi:hypothetical protein
MRGALPAKRASAVPFLHGIQFWSRAHNAMARLAQDHPGRPIIVRCIPTDSPRRIALTRDARPEGLMAIRARFLLTGRAVGIMARGRERG